MAARGDLEVTRPEEDEIGALTAIQKQSLHRSFVRDDWSYKLGVDRLWVVRYKGQIAGVTGILDMGQWFGGRSVPMGGVTAVGVAPEHRGRGTASVLMKRALEEHYAQGLGPIYPLRLDSELLSKAGLRAGRGQDSLPDANPANRR